MRPVRCLIAGAGLLIFGGCGSAPTGSATQPSPLTPAPARVSQQGQATLRSISPASGTTLLVYVCDPDFGTVCASEPRVSVDVDVLRDIESPSLGVSVESGSKECGSFGSTLPRSFYSTPLKAGRYSFEFTEIGFGRECALPIETTRLVVRLWDLTGGIPRQVMAQEFPHAFRFEKR